MVKVEPFSAEHLIDFQVRPEMGGGEWRAQLYPYIGDPKTIAFVGDAGVYAIIGRTDLWPGVVELWALPTTLIHVHPIAFHRAVQRQLALLEQDASIKRIQLCVRVGFEAAEAWAELLGFKIETLMKNYGPETDDYWSYVRFPCGE